MGDRGQRTPFIVRFPEAYRHLAPQGYAPGAASNELVSFVDFAPTLLSLVNADIPDWMHGRAFAGAKRQPAPDYIPGFVGRHDTRLANARSITDGRHVYIRNFNADTPHGTWSNYTQGISATTPAYATLGAAEWLIAWQQGGLDPQAAHFFENHGAEQLYDLATDPDETVNLIDDPNYAAVLDTLRSHLSHWKSEHRDGGLIPEGRLFDLVRETDLTPWEIIASDTHYPYAEVLDTAKRASSNDPQDIAILAERLTHADATIRIWAAKGLGYHGRNAVRAHQSKLETAAGQENHWVKVSALKALALHADAATRKNSIDALFTLTSRIGIVNDGTVNRYAEREIHYAGDAISHLPYLAPSYRNLATSMNNETGLTRAYRRHVYYWFTEEYSHPLGEFRALHGLDKWGADDTHSAAGDGISNLAKYAFNLAPNEGDLAMPILYSRISPESEAGLPNPRFDPRNQTQGFAYLRRNEATGPRIQYRLQQSDDLIDWETIQNPNTVEAIDDIWEHVSHDITEASAKFLRIEVSR